MAVGSAYTSSFSRLAQRSLALRPAHSRCHQFVARYPKASDISSPPCLLRLLPAGAVAGWDLHPLESAALSRRTPEADIGGAGLGACKLTFGLSRSGRPLPPPKARAQTSQTLAPGRRPAPRKDGLRVHSVDGD